MNAATELADEIEDEGADASFIIVADDERELIIKALRAYAIPALSTNAIRTCNAGHSSLNSANWRCPWCEIEALRHDIERGMANHNADINAPSQMKAEEIEMWQYNMRRQFGESAFVEELCELAKKSLRAETARDISPSED